MNKIILADNQAIFRAGTAKVLAMEDDLRIIAQCPDSPRLYHAVNTFRGSVVIVACSLRADLAKVVEGARAVASRVILIAENNETPPEQITGTVQGLMYRDVTSAALIDCVRRVIRGERVIHAALPNTGDAIDDQVGARVRDRLTPKEMKIVALIVQGCKNREIGIRLGTTEQVIKNYLRSIYDKTGVSDRLELALFTIHHRILAEAAAAVGNQMEIHV
ncbi:two component transcriptional regulator, LuxR family [Acidisarcina polymorpha]|uniref:Two component transcriptional regulator, LuxR family n=1 Tax=Acidisarcina polymorpha TaxID=2211140 RepID=A0A2Z5G1G8_9BACT|nr:response regulator transcription factor [Acidisarcina polymorpha]AXC12880.1 two component transcriptional regulator, LuxR family [Acidisarcina polymorpha]